MAEAELKCPWCGKATPADSLFCQACGARLEGWVKADPGQSSETWPTYATFPKGPELPDLPAVMRSADQEPTVDPSSLPLQPDLGKPRIAILAVVSALFGIAVVLLGCLVALHLLGL